MNCAIDLYYSTFLNYKKCLILSKNYILSTGRKNNFKFYSKQKIEYEINFLFIYFSIICKPLKFLLPFFSTNTFSKLF